MFWMWLTLIFVYLTSRKCNEYNFAVLSFMAIAAIVFLRRKMRFEGYRVDIMMRNYHIYDNKKIRKLLPWGIHLRYFCTQKAGVIWESAANRHWDLWAKSYSYSYTVYFTGLSEGSLYNKIGVTGFEPATSRPPAARSNQTEPYPDNGSIIIYLWENLNDYLQNSHTLKPANSWQYW